MRIAIPLLAFATLLGAAACSTTQPAEPVPPTLVTLVPVENEGMHARNLELEQRAQATKDAKLVFLGDSITQGWESVPDLWSGEFGRYGPLNLGVSGDRTEHVLWRLQRGAYDHLRPTAIVIMIGTNNTGHRLDPPADIAAGIDAILGQLRQRHPKARLALLSIFPRGETKDDAMRANNAAVNALLPSIAKAHGAEWLDVSRAFTDSAGTLSKSVMPDLLHPNASGYAVWANAIRAPLARWMTQ